MTPPDYTTKKTHWQIQHRDLSHGARLYHYWFIIADNLSSLENAKDCLAFEKRDSHSSSEEFRIVRVETSIKEFVETVWRGIKTHYIITMHKELHEHRCRLFTIYVLRLLEREKEWNADTVDEIADAAFDLSLASTDEHGNFIANNFEKAVDAE